MRQPVRFDLVHAVRRALVVLEVPVSALEVPLAYYFSIRSRSRLCLPDGHCGASLVSWLHWRRGCYGRRRGGT